MKKITVLFISLLISTSLFAAGGDGGGSSGGGDSHSKASLYDDAVKLVKRAGKLEKKENIDKAKNSILKLLLNWKRLIKKIKKIQIYLTIWVLHQEK